MGKINVPAAPALKTTRYSNFCGVDFSQDPSLIERRRSPMAVNLISDNGGNPVKRIGWRCLFQLEAPVHNIWYGEISGDEVIVCHAGSKIYKIDEKNSGATVLRDNVSNLGGCGFFFRMGDAGKLFILTGDEYLVYDGETVKDVCEAAYVPTIVISKNPDGGGTIYESVNLLQSKRSESFLGNATAKDYYLSANEIDDSEVTVRVQGSSGWSDLAEGSDYTVDRKLGKVSFTSAKVPVIVGQDNVIITYSKTVSGYADRIKKCTVFAIYGHNASNRVFLSGNADYKAQDWYSAAYDPTYFPDTNYSVIGTSDTAIMGYSKVGEYLTIVKEDNQQDTTVFFRYSNMLDGKTVFPVNPGVSGIGAISKGCFVNLGDEPLFLSRRGIYALASTLLSSKYVTRNRSFYVDKKLTVEEDLSKAVACEWDGYYLLSVNSRVYILDGRRKTSDSFGNSDFLYEAYYWENVPAVCFLSVGGRLYFGTADGRICKFNTDVYGMTKFNDDGEYTTGGSEVRYVSGGKPIVAEWATPNDADDGVQYFKTLNKKGCLAVLSPMTRSSCECFFVADGNPEELVTSDTFDIFDWEDIDFERFTFSTNETPQEVYFNKKKKKYKRLQIVIRNSALNEGFGIHEIVKTYSVGNFSKNRRV